MTGKKRAWKIASLTLALIVLASAVSLGAQSSPYATIVYAEGTSFRLVRDNKVTTYNLVSEDVFGLEVKSGDVIHTAASTVLEISIHPIKASVQLAENTSFRCVSDSTGEKSSGELFYGRVRAKVGKLTGATTYQISSPSMVAGVRGTDFGADVIAQTTLPSSPVLSRVFCFEGSVLVSEPERSHLGTVLLTGNDMVERVVDNQKKETVSVPLEKKPVIEDVRVFWDALPAIGYTPVAVKSASPEAPKVTAPAVPEQTGLTVIARPWPRRNEEITVKRNLSIPNGTAIALIGIGTAACLGSTWWNAHYDNSSWFAKPVNTGGLVVISSGVVLAVFSALFD